MERKSYLTNKAFRMFLGASILTSLSAMLGNIVDGIIVSHLIDHNAMSAISLSRPIIQGNYTFYQLVGLGASILVANALGMNDKVRVNALVTTTVIVLAMYSIAESLIGIFCPDVVVDAICSSAELHDYARAYFVPLLIGTPAFIAVYFLGGFTSIDGAPKLVSRAMLIDNVVNLCMDVVLIKVIDFGVMGSSIATVIGHLTAIAIISTHYISGKSQYRLTFRSVLGNALPAQNFQFSFFTLIRDACSTGLPFAIASICMTFYLYATQDMIGANLGRDGLFIFSVMLSIMTFYNMFVTGACSTMQQLAALQLGMGDSYAHRMTVFSAFRFMNMFLGAAFIILLICPELVARMFDCPEGLMAECCGGVRIYGGAFWLFCNLYLIMVNYKLLKLTALSTFVSLALNLSVIPVMWVVIMYFKDMVWWSNLIAYLIVLVCVTVASCIYMLRNKDSRFVPMFLLPLTDKFPQINFSFGYSEEEMHKAFDDISAWLRQQNLSNSIIFRVRIIAEELMSNITRHSVQKSRKACADVRLVITPSPSVDALTCQTGEQGGGTKTIEGREGTVTFAITDDGTPFNPIENKDKGYGLMIANGAASEISYKYQFGQNMTTVKIKP